MTRSDEDLLRFVSASFQSVWALELLLVLKMEGEPVTRQELIKKLRASELVVSKALDALVAAGLASIDKDAAIYLPVNQEVRRRICAIEELYHSRPDTVRRAIVARATSSATAFSDAFKLRRGRDD